jgi:hypothetical protein
MILLTGKVGLGHIANMFENGSRPSQLTQTLCVHFSGEGSNFGATPVLTQSRMMQIPNNDDLLL